MGNGFSVRLGFAVFFLLSISPIEILAAEKKDDRFQRPRVPGRVLVKFKAPGDVVVKRQGGGTRGMQSTREMTRYQRRLSASAEESVQQSLASSVLALQRKLGLGSVRGAQALEMEPRVYKVDLLSDAQVESAVELLAERSDVSFAEPDYIVYADRRRVSLEDFPNDPDFNQQWALQNTGQEVSRYSESIPGADINVVPLWEDGEQGNWDVVVAVIDSGIDMSHPELLPNIWSNPGEFRGDLRDNDRNGFVDDANGWNFVDRNSRPIDGDGHGTHVSGTIGALGNDGRGVAGVAWNVQIMPLKALSDEGTGSTSGIVDAMYYAVLEGAHVINASYGSDGVSFLEEEAVFYAMENDVVIVAAAGNDEQDNDQIGHYPASYQYPNVISVAASNHRDRLASFSNYGKHTVHLAAPGYRILSTVNNQDYDTYSGTSMAAPHVSGAVALLRSIHPRWDHERIRETLIKSSDPRVGIKGKIIASGRINITNAAYEIFPEDNLPENPIDPEEPEDPDPEDLEWQTIFEMAESPHPYEGNHEYIYHFSWPGARFVRVYFEKIDVEPFFDQLTLEIVDPTEIRVLQQLEGQREWFYSEPIEGDRVTIRLKTDLMTNHWGYRVDRFEVVKDF